MRCSGEAPRIQRSKNERKIPRKKAEAVYHPVLGPVQCDRGAPKSEAEKPSQFREKRRRQCFTPVEILDPLKVLTVYVIGRTTEQNVRMIVFDMPTA